MRVVTRMRPKRMEELIGGSLHWIVKHRIIARQRILRFEDRNDGRINIVCSDDLVIVPPVPPPRITICLVTVSPPEVTCSVARGRAPANVAFAEVSCGQLRGCAVE